MNGHIRAQETILYILNVTEIYKIQIGTDAKQLRDLYSNGKLT